MLTPQHPGTALCGSGRERGAPLAVGAAVLPQVLHPQGSGGCGCGLLWWVVSEHLLLLRARGMCPVLTSSRGGRRSAPLGANSRLPCCSFREIIPKRNNKQEPGSDSLRTWVGSRPKCFQTQIDFPAFLLLYWSQIIHFRNFAVLQLVLLFMVQQ